MMVYVLAHLASEDEPRRFGPFPLDELRLEKDGLYHTKSEHYRPMVNIYSYMEGCCEQCESPSHSLAVIENGKMRYDSEVFHVTFELATEEGSDE